jgi:hypothetical protein
MTRRAIPRASRPSTSRLARLGPLSLLGPLGPVSRAWLGRSLRAALSTLALVAGVLGVAGIVLHAAPANAQIAAALGKPLPSPDLPVGTVSVRIVAGSASSPVVGTDVTVIVNEAPRVARTDSAGRATFAGLPAGATVVAKVLDEDKTEHASEPFAIPAEGGTRVMITTKPWQAGAGAGATPPMAGGGPGMPNPRQMSGEPRPQQGDPAGMITVRVVYDDFNDNAEGVPVALIGYAADDSTSFQTATTDKGGRVQFTELDRSGGTSYFALALVPRNGAIDRLMSSYMVLESQMGVRVLLSSEKRDAKSASLDDLGKLFDPQVATPAGQVRVAIEGFADAKSTITLIDAATKKVLGTAKPTTAPADPSRIESDSQFQADDKLPAGTLAIEVFGGAGQTEAPLGDIEIRVVPASSSDPAGGVAAKTAADGTARVTVTGSEPQKAVYTVNGRAFTSRPFEVGPSGGKLVVIARWDDSPRLQALFDVAAAPGQIVYAECAWLDQHSRSLPFQLLAATGTKISIYAWPRLLFRFRLESDVEDNLLAVRGQFQLDNNSWAPYRAGPDGMVIPLPRGFKGAVVAENDQSEVAAAAGEGFRIVRPIPPVGKQFHGGFSLPVEGGNVQWSFDLPLGAYQSQLVIRKTPEMTVTTEGVSVPSETRTVQQGTFVLMQPITIKPKQSMVLSLGGLPSTPAWRTWLPGIVGVLVIGVMVAGVVFALMRKPVAASAAASAASASRRQRLLDELVDLERTGDNPKRRDQVLHELEELWG